MNSVTCTYLITDKRTGMSKQNAMIIIKGILDTLRTTFVIAK